MLISIPIKKDKDLYRDYQKSVEQLNKILLPNYRCTLEVYPVEDPIPLSIHICKIEEGSSFPREL